MLKKGMYVELTAEIFMLPVDEVFENNAHVIFEEAENRLHTQKAIMALTMAE